MKKLFTLLVGAVVGLGAYAQDFDSGGLMYSVLSPDDKTCAVTGWVEAEYNLTIPETVNYEGEDYTVTEIGEGALRGLYLYNLNLPSTLVKIDNQAFYNINGLRELVIPNSVKEVGSYSFAYCWGVQRLELGSSLENIGVSAFESTPIKIVVALGEKPALCEYGYTNAITTNPLVGVPENAITEYQASWDGANIVPYIPAESLTFDSSEYRVQPGSTVQLNWTVEPENAPVIFSSDDTNVVTVDGSGLVTADNLRGGYGTNVTVMALNGLTSTCYIQTESLEEFESNGFVFIVLPNVENEVAIIRYESGSTIVDIPETVEYNGSEYSVTTIGPSVFGWRSDIEEVTIPSSIKLIREYNFNYCSSLKKVTIADSETTLDLSDNNFTDDSSLEELYVGRNLIHLGSGYYLRWVDSLTKIVLGTEVTSLPDYLFEGCAQLSLVESNNPVPPVLGERALGWNVQNILVPAESVETYQQAWEQYASLITLPVDAESISFETEEVILYNGQRLKLPIIIEPANAIVTFTSSDSYLVPVDKEGYVEYYSWRDNVGEVIITASSLNDKTAECKVIAKHWLTFSEDNVTLTPNSNYQVEVSRPEVIADAEITWWSANEEVATVDENGVITAVAGGDARILASVNVPGWEDPFSYSIRVNVRNYPTAVIAEEPTMTVWQGWEQAIHLNYEPQDDQYLNCELTWTVADPEIVEVKSIEGSTNYSIIGLKAGTTTITGETPNGVTVEIEVVVKAQIEQLIFPADRAYVAPGGDYQLEFTTVPEVTNQTFTYTSDNEEIATIDENGLIHGVALGSTQIAIWYEGPWGTEARWYRVEVCYMPETVTLENSEIEMYVKETKQLDLIFTPEDADLNKEMTWTVDNPEIARISGNNYYDENNNYIVRYEIVGLAEGTTRFVGTTVNGITVEGDVTVKPLMGPESVTLVNNEITVNVDTYEKLDLQFTPSENVNTEITWEIDKSVAEIYTDEFWNYETGNYEPGYAIRGVNFGETNFEGIAANGDVINGHVTVAGIKIIDTPNEVTIGEEFELNFIASEDVNLEGVTYYSSNPDILSVSEDGVVSANNCGSTWLYIQYNEDGKIYGNDIYVIVRPVSGTIALSQSQVIMLPNYSVGVDVLFPLDEYYDITWETSDPNVATIYGGWSWATIYYAGLGTATITATASNGATATCEVSCIALNKTDLIMGLDQTRQLEILGIPEDMNVRVDWYAYNTYNVDEGDNPDDPEMANVVRINDEGVITSENIGRARVGAYIYNAANGDWIGELNTYVDVIENFQYVAAIILNESAIEAKEGETVQLIATVDPADATDQQLAWSSSDESVATVDQNGLVTIVAEGFAVITATATDGSNISANCYISGLSGINGIFGDGEPADVYNMNGILVKKDATADDFNKLAPGIYVVRRGNVSTKLIRR